MKFEDGFNTLEQGKEFERLFKELEKPPQSYHVWAVKVDVGGGRDRIVLIPRKEIESYHRDIIPAFSCAELGGLLPCEVFRSQILYLNIIKEIKGFVCGYVWSDWCASDDMDIQKKSKHEARCKADLVILLLEQEIIKPEKLKI